MPFDSEGNFNRVHNWEEDKQNKIKIFANRHDEEDDNFAEGFNETLLRDGRAPMSGDLNLNNFQIKKLLAGTFETDAVNKSQLDTVNKRITDLFNAVYKIGDIKASLQTTNHRNWYLCNGQALNRVTFSRLFSLIGTNFGVGDGSTTFNLPDYRGKFLRGLGGDSESDFYKTQAESLPDHKHTVSVNARKDGGQGHKDQLPACSTAGFTEYTTELASKDNPIYDGKHVTPINQAVNFFIKVAEEK